MHVGMSIELLCAASVAESAASALLRPEAATLPKPAAAALRRSASAAEAALQPPPERLARCCHVARDHTAGAALAPEAGGVRSLGCEARRVAHRVPSFGALCRHSVTWNAIQQVKAKFRRIVYSTSC